VASGLTVKHLQSALTRDPTAEPIVVTNVAQQGAVAIWQMDFPDSGGGNPVGNTGEY